MSYQKNIKVGCERVKFHNKPILINYLIDISDGSESVSPAPSGQRQASGLLVSVQDKIQAEVKESLAREEELRKRRRSTVEIREEEAEHDKVEEKDEVGEEEVVEQKDIVDLEHETVPRVSGCTM